MTKTHNIKKGLPDSVCSTVPVASLSQDCKSGSSDLIKRGGEMKIVINHSEVGNWSNIEICNKNKRIAIRSYAGQENYKKACDWGCVLAETLLCEVKTVNIDVITYKEENLLTEQEATL